METATFSELEQAVIEKSELPARVAMTVCFYATTYGSVVVDREHDEPPKGWSLLFTAPLSFDVPRLDRTTLTQKQIEALENEREKLRAELGARIQSINEYIQSLRALEYKPEAS